MRRAYAKEVKRAKGAWEEKEQAKLEELVKHSKQWWKGLKKLRLVDKGDTRRDVSKVRDVNGDMKQGKEAVTVWTNHFEKLLNAGQPGEGERAIRDLGKQNNSLLNEDLTMQKVMWTLGKLGHLPRLRLSEEELGTRSTKASWVKVLDRYSAERAQRVQVGHDTALNQLQDQLQHTILLL